MEKVFPRFIFLLFLILSHQTGYTSEKFTVRDLWTAKPLPDVQIIYGIDTLNTDELGSFYLIKKEEDAQKLKIFYQGYFESIINPSKLSNNIIYLIPIETAPMITVVQPKEADSRLMLPAHVSRIELNENSINHRATLDRILASENGILIKSYGASGQLQTISLRGMSAEQTQILLDGVPLNSLQLGSVDLGQFGLQNMGSLEIYRGGNPLFGGSGAIGGTIDLHPGRPAETFSYGLTYRHASFDNKLISARFDIPIGQFYQRIYLSKSSGVNEYKTNFEDKEITLQNRDYDRLNLVYQNALNLSSRIQINTYLSTYKSEAGSPKPFVSPPAEKSNLARTESDYNLAKLQLKYDSPGGGFFLQGYIRNEWMNYDDPSLLLNQEPLHSLHFNQEQGLQLRGRSLLNNRLLIHFGAEGAWQKVHSTDAGKHKRQRYAAYILSDWAVLSNTSFLSSLHLNTSARLESYSELGPVFLPGLGISAQWRDWQVYGSIGKNYRAPTFNDLYWQPGGNEELKPESSYNSELGVEYQSTYKIVVLDVKLSSYMNRVNDQIKWLPGDGIWQPENVAQVYSRGLEFESALTHINEIHQVKFNYTYGLSEKNKAEFPGDKTVGNQLPYLPREQWHLTLQSGWQALLIGVQGSAMSFRYKTLQNDPDQILPSHVIWRLWNSYNWKFYKNSIRITIAVNNIFDCHYELMTGYPMPPRNFSLSITLKY